MRVQTIRAFIQDEILNDTRVQIETDQDLLLTEMLDSLGVARLVAYLETEYGLEIPPEDVTLENFATLRLIDGYIHSRGN